MRRKCIAFLMLLVMVTTSVLMAGCGGGPQKPASSGSGSGSGAAAGKGSKLVIYTSMKEALISGIIEGFKKKNPDIDVDYQSAGAGKLMAKIAAERQSGQILADVIWTSEVPDFYQMKSEGILENYKPSNLGEILNPFTDYDGSFTAARLGTLGIVINTDKVKTPPTQWEDLATKPEYKNAFGIADPALSGTAYMSVALLEKQFGWDYFNRLHANGARIGKGSGQVVDDTSSGELTACLGVDYITNSKIAKGAHLSLVYPKELLMVPSPVAIFKGSKNIANAKKFVDYLLSQEAQQKVADAGTVPVRKDVKIPEKYHLPSPEDALKNGIKVTYTEILPHKQETIKKFTEIIGKK
ncbi:MAG: ABC transporter substrate-binding protein [Schwartzia sp.]|nr:ABC transporter substrate-binding protein [Schwartzia sp. (in: firmicutes)]